MDKVCKPFIYPTPYKLHFSNSYKEGYKTDLAGVCKTLSGVDKDLAAHITVINKVGITLCGQGICDVFEPIPKQFYIDSILYDIENADEEITEEPVYFILNLCRVLAYLQDDLVLSKKQGGEWGGKNLPAIYSKLIQNALECYSANSDFTETDLIFSFAKFCKNCAAKN